MFFVSWGTTVRTRVLGDRAEFCPGCMQPTRFTVKTSQTANHLYGIPLGYTDGASYGECTICGARIEPMFDDAIVPVGTHSYEAMLARTNPRMTPQTIKTLYGITGDARTRQDHSLRYFLAKLEATVRCERSKFGTGTSIAAVVSLLLVFLAAHATGAIGGAIAAVLALTAILILWSVETRFRARRKILPNLQRYLLSQGISFEDLERKLRSQELRFPKLQRHLASSSYDAERAESAFFSGTIPDDIANLFLNRRAQVQDSEEVFIATAQPATVQPTG